MPINVSLSCIYWPDYNLYSKGLLWLRNMIQMILLMKMCAFGIYTRLFSAWIIYIYDVWKLLWKIKYLFKRNKTRHTNCVFCSSNIWILYENDTGIFHKFLHDHNPLGKTSPVETRPRKNMNIWLYMKVFRTSFDVTNDVETLWWYRDVNDVVTTSWKRRDVIRHPGNFHIQPITNVVSTSGFVVTSNDVLMTYFAEWEDENKSVFPFV